MTRRDKLTTWAIELIPAFVVALLVVPFVISHGHLWPWQPNMADLDVYRGVAQVLLERGDLYAYLTPKMKLPFIYPPIAAYFALPLAILPLTMARMLWLALTILAQQVILARVGVQRGLTLGMLNVLLVLAFEPFRTTLGYGQVNTFLMALVVADLLPVAKHRRLPQGALIGIAAAIKLTPLLFIVFALLIRKWKVARNAVYWFGGLSIAGTILEPTGTVRFLTKVLEGDTYGDPVYIGNQSLGAVFNRQLGLSEATSQLGTRFSMVVCLLGLGVAFWLWRKHHPVLAVGIVGVTTCLAAPLSWTHHFVWALPVIIGALQAATTRRDGRRLPRWLAYPLVGWGVWVASCPVLAFLPYGHGKELKYTLFQRVVANIGPIFMFMMLVALAIYAVLMHFSADDQAASPDHGQEPTPATVD